jgi:hypothetical protein
MIRSGLKRKNVEYNSPVLHLFHGRSMPNRHANASKNPGYFNSLEADTDRFLPIKSALMPLAETA